VSLSLILAIFAMLLAATLYTVAVFGERKAGVLKPRHLGFFWFGLVFDTAGTTLMGGIAGGFEFDVHGFLGAAAIVLMLVHTVWATWAITKRNERVLHDFHRFSVHVWAMWMVALVSGFVMVALRAR
jgi:uncharacterized repeat protein (TIGR03987 family)